MQPTSEARVRDHVWVLARQCSGTESSRGTTISSADPVADRITDFARI